MGGAGVRCLLFEDGMPLNFQPFSYNIWPFPVSLKLFDPYFGCVLEDFYKK